MRNTGRTIAIVGAGLLGCLGAIALSRRGRRVVLFERDGDILGRASRFNEGKVHLGFTYGLDRSGETAARMFAYGIRFKEELARLLDRPVEEFFLHQRCIYAVAGDSALALEDALLHLDTLDGLHASHLASGGAPATASGPFIRRLTGRELAARFCDTVTAAFDVAEPILDCDRLCDGVAAAVRAEPGIEIVAGCAVHAIEAAPVPTVVDADGNRHGPFDRIVNAAWDGMPAIEHNSGRPAEGHSLRGKTGFVAEVRKGMPEAPVTFCWGMYGDIVPQSRDHAYVSWYPSCRMGFTTGVSAGSGWFDAVAESFDFDRAYQDCRAAFSRLLPNLELAEEPAASRAGAILAHARTDLQDPGSGLHRRTDFGIHPHDRVLAVNTGKLSCAPGLAAQLAEIA
ncbi:FAD-dependent oxidoreductase [Rhodobium gokarnense]|uniref:Glycine/D-amino acid oxidase-like deaminating enzyme n=1 Tax=Rhodobium gokarnense TaxID=364296 RepID=A0ABT3H736_9HYPH|nr:FAD-dependent oxidoreductase [Rhodobium gokarnense]MCW2306204.1 glycine/D-amino acid oxidase-like deaminating enzyme [Rhodobium gokarnense]